MWPQSLWVFRETKTTIFLSFFFGSIRVVHESAYLNKLLQRSSFYYSHSLSPPIWLLEIASTAFFIGLPYMDSLFFVCDLSPLWFKKKPPEILIIEIIKMHFQERP